MKNILVKTITTATFIFVATTFLFAQNTITTVSEFAAVLKATKNPQILDARSPEEFAINHIEGAININLKDSLSLEKILASLQKDYPTFAYSINNGRSNVLTNKLRAKGFKTVYELPGGLANWVGSGNALVSTKSKNAKITSQQFNESIKGNELVLVNYASNFCGICRRLVPIIDSLKNTHATNLSVFEVGFDDNLALFKELQITALPTLALYKNGILVWKNTGYISYQSLHTAIESKANLVIK
jgi:rhodanese-related sulfurtransferase